MASRGPSKKIDKFEPLLTVQVTWIVTKTIKAESDEDLRTKTNMLTTKLERDFETVDLQEEEDLDEHPADDDEDDEGEHEDDDEPPEGDLNFDD
jgi:hypothetical protein